MPNFLLELFSEEIPARMQKQALADTAKIWADLCKDKGVNYTEISSYITPRRLTVHIADLPLELPALKEEVKGPRVSAPEQALAGFLKSQEATKDQLTEYDDPKGAYYVLRREKPAIKLDALLPELVHIFLTTFPWPKSQRWGSNSFRWVRPLHNILAVFDDTVLPGEFSLGHDVLPYTNQTFGHRFLKPDALQVTDFSSYKQELNDAFIMLDTEDRKADIHRQLTALAEKHHITLKEDPALLQEMAGAAEWPQVFMGHIPEAYVILPDEVLTTAMRVHQKYFAFEKTDGSLAPFFATVANNIPHDQGVMIIEGNEQILESRLFDAHFFWNQDLKANFNDWSEKLKAITFHAKLGSLHDRASRLQKSASKIAKLIKADDKKAARAAELAKIDLVSSMVFEFPELQGIMGGHYALAKNEPEEVANAIKSHYAPQGPQDECPNEPVSIALALADKLDTLVGFFGINEKPTGSKDPYALRRAALGMIRLVLENDISVDLSELIKISAETYCHPEQTNCHPELDLGAHDNKDKVPKQVRDDGQPSVQHDTITRGLVTFFKERLKVTLRDQGYPHDYVMAVLATGDNVLLITERAKALQDFLNTAEGKALLALYGRASSILKKEKTDSLSVDPKLLSEPAEIALHTQIQELEPHCLKALDAQNYVKAMETLAPLKHNIDSFFDQVTVNDKDEEKKKNRFALLQAVLTLIHFVADLSQIEG